MGLPIGLSLGLSPTGLIRVWRMVWSRFLTNQVIRYDKPDRHDIVQAAWRRARSRYAGQAVN